MIGDKVYCSDRHDLPLFLHVRCQLTLCCTYMIIIRQWCCFGTCTIVILWKQSSMPNYLCVWHMFSIAHFLQECYGCIFEIFLWDRNSSNFSPFITFCVVVIYALMHTRNYHLSNKNVAKPLLCFIIYLDCLVHSRFLCML